MKKNTKALFLLIPILAFTSYVQCHQANHKEHIETAQEYSKKGEHLKAIDHYNHALALAPENLQTKLNLAIEYYHLHEYAASLELLNELSIVIPNHYTITFLKAKIFKANRQMNNAIKHYKKAIKLNPNNRSTYTELGYAYLVMGDYQKGHETWGIPAQNQPTVQKNDQYDGSSDLHGKTILIQDEGGFGDLFQWIRFARELKEKGAHIVVEARKPAIPLLSCCPYIDKVIPQKSNFTNFDYKMHAGSLFHIKKITLETIPNKVPYLYPDKRLVEKWHNKLSNDHNFKIGICWDPQAYLDPRTGKPINNTRAIPLTLFYELGKIKEVSLYSLQQKNGLEQIKTMPKDFKLHTFDNNFDKTYGSFMDTAAVMKNLDLIITADTSIAHLAGALGVKTWTLLPFFADWRWMINRSDSPWYPTMRLFRQQEAGQWNSVIGDVLVALSESIARYKTQ